VIVVGHGRVAATRLLDLERVLTLCLDHLGEAERRAYAIADNKLAENAGWDGCLLALEMHYIAELDISLDLTLTGFEIAEIDLLLGSLDPTGEADPADAPPEPVSGPPVTRPGDLWALGRHRLLCGDATRVTSYAQLMGEGRARMVFTDPAWSCFQPPLARFSEVDPSKGATWPLNETSPYVAERRSAPSQRRGWPLHCGRPMRSPL
jgi:hypothetical protein